MRRRIVLVVTLAVLAGYSFAVVHGQRVRQPRRPPRTTGEKKEKEEEPKHPPLPDDQRLLALHLEFVKKAERLAKEYETAKQYHKAADVYVEILKLVPQYPAARNKLAAIRKMEATAQKVLFTVQANKGWQDTGVTVQPGRPVIIRAGGVWTFNLSSQLGPEGMTIPEELRDYNLGCLIGAINTGNPKELKPFVVGSQYSMIAEKKGRLFLRMYDIKPDDNKGSLKVEILGTFQEK